MYWTLKAVSVHSGITKSRDGKSYHPYICDSIKHDQSFVDIVIREMLSEEDVAAHDLIVVDSDNCTSQYKSVLDLHHYQMIANDYNKTLIKMYGVPSHGKGEVDHVGGTAKVVSRRLAATRVSFSGANDIVAALREKFAEKTEPRYSIKEISEAELEKARRADNATIVNSVYGSSTFRVIIFKPPSDIFRDSSRLCV